MPDNEQQAIDAADAQRADAQRALDIAEAGGSATDEAFAEQVRQNIDEAREAVAGTIEPNERPPHHSQYRDAPAVQRIPDVSRLRSQDVSEGNDFAEAVPIPEPGSRLPGPVPGNDVQYSGQMRVRFASAEPIPESTPPILDRDPPAVSETVAANEPLQTVVMDGNFRMIPPYPEDSSNVSLGLYDTYCYCHPCQVIRNYRRLVYAYEQQGEGDALPRRAYRSARRQADRIMGAWRCDDTSSRNERENWDSEFKAAYAAWAHTHGMRGYPVDGAGNYLIEYSESSSQLSPTDQEFVATPTGYEPPVEINFASAALNEQVSSYERQVVQAKDTIGMAASELRGGRLALKGLYVQQDNAAKAVKNSDDLREICKEMPEIIGVRYGPCPLPGGESLQQGEVEVLFLPVLYGRSTRNGIQKRLTTPVSFRIMQDGRVYGAGRTNYHPHLRSNNICLGYMGARQGYTRGASVELILTTLAGVNDIGGMLKLMSAWRLGHNSRDELSHEWRWDGARDFFDTAMQKQMWPEWDGTTVQYAPRGVIGPLDKWLPGIFDVPNLTRTQIGQAIYLLWKGTGNLSPHLDPYLVTRLNDLEKGQCRTCYEPAITLSNKTACLSCTKKEGLCACPANRYKVSRHLVRFFPQDNVMFYPVRPPEQSTLRRYGSSPIKSFWWCAGRHNDYRGNYKYSYNQCGNGPTLSANPLYGMAWLQCEAWSTNPWCFKAMQPQEMRCANHSIGSMRGERGEMGING